jgi:hypothetical protein
MNSALIYIIGEGGVCITVLYIVDRIEGIGDTK